MFHDIQDTSTMHLKNFSGGVPLFWAHLTAHVQRSRLAEFTFQPPEVKCVCFYTLLQQSPYMNHT